MNSDDTITIDLSNTDLGMYPYTSMSDTLIVSSSALSGSSYTTDSVTLTLDPSFQISLDDNMELGSWYEERRILDEYHEEKVLRENNEGIQKAWEQYKILVELAKNPPECT